MYNIILSDGPIQIGISPPDTTYTFTETGSVNQITCTADCNPSCTTTWTGPNLPAGSTSIMNLQNIDRSQAGVYNCTAVNEISSLTLIKVNVIVNCKYEMSMVYSMSLFILHLFYVTSQTALSRYIFLYTINDQNIAFLVPDSC
jgi:hypothetical protein